MTSFFCFDCSHLSSGQRFSAQSYCGRERRQGCSPSSLALCPIDRNQYLHIKTTSPAEIAQKSILKGKDLELNFQELCTVLSIIGSTIETLMSSIEFTNGNTEHKIIELLKFDGSLTIAQLYPLLKMSRKGVQKAIERLKDKGILYREGSTKGGRWIVSQKS